MSGVTRRTATCVIGPQIRAQASAAAAPVFRLPAATREHPRLRPLFGIRSRVPDAGGVVLTFDDGPHPEGTPAILAELARHGARATFFVVGEQVARKPALAREIAAEGHEVAVHCFRHRSVLSLTTAEVRDDLRRAAAVIADATGHVPALYRPPYGEFSLPALLVARRKGWRCLLWTHDGRDWEAGATPTSICRNIVSKGIRSSDVVLLHDADHYANPGSWRHAAAALPLLLEELERQGLPAVQAGASKP
jgi:peptidoglycan-N-acetylglucosamine deacetylase